LRATLIGRGPGFAAIVIVGLNTIVLSVDRRHHHDF